MTPDTAYLERLLRECYIFDQQPESAHITNPILHRILDPHGFDREDIL